jgi:hypothetical protein
MPATMTYDSLVQDIKDYLERGDVADETVLRQIPRIINNTERLLADKLKITGYLQSVTSTMQTGVSVISKPAGWRSTVSINYGTGVDSNVRTSLRIQSYEYIRACFTDDTELGEPIYYADYDLNHWFVQPTPASDYPFEAMVYMLPPLLDETNQENYLTKFAPFLLLYSCLSGMEPFLRNDSRVPVWQALATENFQAINMEDLRRMVDRAQTRDTN